jgi:hypothetical protein
MSLMAVMVAFQNCSPSKFESMMEPSTQTLAVVDLIPEEPEPLPPAPTPTPGTASDPLAQCQVTGDSPLIAVGARRTISCPANCPNEDVYGSDIYTSDTPVCLAAVHAGVILKSAGGSVTYQYVGSFPGPFESSNRRGLESQPWEGAWNAFQILRPSGTDVTEMTETEEPGLQPSTCTGAFQTGLVCRKPMKVAIITDNAPTLSDSTVRKCRAYCQALGGSSCCGLTKSSEFPGQYNCMAGRDEVPALYQEPSPMDYDLNLANKFNTETRAMSCSSSFAAENAVLFKPGALKCGASSFVESEYASIASLPAGLANGTDVFGQSISGIKAHYYSQGYLDKRSTSLYAERQLKSAFNGEAYAAVNWDVLLAGIPAYHHYQSCGYTQDRAAYPSIDFK